MIKFESYLEINNNNNKNNTAGYNKKLDQLYVYTPMSMTILFWLKKGH